MASANTKASDQTISLGVQDKIKMEKAIRLEVAKAITGVPWRSTDVAKTALTHHLKAVETVIKLSVPFDHPEFTMQALDLLLDLDPDTPLTTDRTESPEFQLGKKVRLLPSELEPLMEGFVDGKHGQLTGWRINMEQVQATWYQQTGREMTPDDVESSFRLEQRHCITSWICKHHDTRLKKCLVSIRS